MKLNKKGITLTEIIISIALISLVLIFLFSLLVVVNDINKESEVNSTYLIGKSLILKNIEEDLSKEGVSFIIGECQTEDFFTSYKIDEKDMSGNIKRKYFSYEDKPLIYRFELAASKCYKFDFGSEGVGFLSIYFHKVKNSYVISYVHNNVRVTKELPDFEKYNLILSDTDSDGINDKAELRDWTYTTESGFNTFTIPIIGSDEKDYSIIISYYK